ncbi:MAG: tRNA (adenosine(37)-N6)-threonylcarbamoyltransferase complex dimerization subunit type 1 TsaB [Alphaproteobacteria bacterium]|nr:tRNA (adenosine(37)-N6)-threonylcarbamoyltransferase complex dimerization subunit type 1 TsaB [Alphaproteobacteria bacterium]
MRILALDTCLAACSAAIWQGGRVLAHQWRAMQRGHAEALLPMLEEVRAAAGFEYSDFDRLAVSIGPGSFAGVRVGLAAARGICVARGLPLVGVNTLEVMAAAVDAATPFGVAIDARNHQVYFQAFAGGAALSPPAILSLSEAAAYLRGTDSVRRLAGDGAAAIAAVCPFNVEVIQGDLLPDAAHLAGIAALRRTEDPVTVSPLYLRAPDAKMPGTAA